MSINTIYPNALVDIYFAVYLVSLKLGSARCSSIRGAFYPPKCAPAWNPPTSSLVYLINEQWMENYNKEKSANLLGDARMHPGLHFLHCPFELSSHWDDASLQDCSSCDKDTHRIPRALSPANELRRLSRLYSRNPTSGTCSSTIDPAHCPPDPTQVAPR